MADTTGYVNGSDLLINVGGKAVGHCSTHTLSFESETKDHAVKPLASLAKSSGLFKDKAVTGLSISISAEGFRFYGETENGFTELSALWGAGDEVEVVAYQRGTDTNPYLKGKFVISSLEESAPAQDDATYTIKLENSGEPDVFPGKTEAA